MVDNAALRSAVIRARINSPAYRAAVPYGAMPAANAVSQDQVRPYWQRLLAPLLAPSSGVQSAFAEGAREVRRRRGEDEDADTSVPFWEAAKYGVGEILTGQYGSEENAFGAGAAGAWLGDEREYTGARLVEDLYSSQDLAERSNINKALQATALDFGLDPLLLPVGKGIKTATNAVTKPYGQASRLRAANLQNAGAPPAPSAPPSPGQAGPPAPVGPRPSTPTSPAPTAPTGRPTVPHPVTGEPVDADIWDKAKTLADERDIDTTGGISGRTNLADLIDEASGTTKPTPAAPSTTPPTKPPAKPRSILGGMSNDQLIAIANDPSVPPAMRQAANEELTKRKVPTKKPDKEAQREKAAVAQQIKQTGDLADQKTADDMLKDLDESYKGPAASAEYADELEMRMRAKETPAENAPTPTTNIPTTSKSGKEAPAVLKTRKLTAQLDAAKAKYAQAEEELAAITGREADLNKTAQRAARRIAPLQERVAKLDDDIETFETLIKDSKGRGAANADLVAELDKAKAARQRAVDDLEALTRERDAADAELATLNAGDKSQANVAAQKRTEAFQGLQKAQKEWDKGLAAGLPKPGRPASLPPGATIGDALSRLGEVQDVTNAAGRVRPQASASEGMFGEPAREAAKKRNAGEVPAPVAQERWLNKRAQRGVVNADHTVYGTTRFPQLSQAIAASATDFAVRLREALANMEVRLGVPVNAASPASRRAMQREGLHHDLPHDTPAERVLADNIADLTAFGHTRQNIMKYNPLSSMVPYGPEYSRQVRTGFAQVRMHSRVTVDVPNRPPGEHFDYDLGGDEFWDLVEGKRIEVNVPDTDIRVTVGPEDVQIRGRLTQARRLKGGDQKVPYVTFAKIKQWQDKALNSQSWWENALRAAEEYTRVVTLPGGKKVVGGRYARAQLEEHKRMGARFRSDVDTLRKEWLQAAAVATNLPITVTRKKEKIPGPLLRAWDAASKYLEDEYAAYLDSIGRNDYSRAFLNEDSVHQLAKVLEGAARGYYGSAEELNVAVATVKARKLTKKSTQKEAVAEHHDKRAVEATAAQDEVTAAAAKKKADEARQEAKDLADQAEKELNDAQTAFDVSISEKHQAVFDAAKPFAVPLAPNARRDTAAVNKALRTQLDLEVATFGAKGNAGKKSATAKYEDVLYDQTETIDRDAFGSDGKANLRATFRQTLVAVDNAVTKIGQGKLTGRALDSNYGVLAKARDIMSTNFRSRRKGNLVDTDGYYRMLNRVLVASLSRNAIATKPHIQGLTKAHGLKKLPNGNYAGYAKPTTEDIATGNFVNKAVEMERPPGSINYDPGMVLDALERSAPGLLRHIYKRDDQGRVLLEDFFTATLWKTDDSLAKLRKADPELARWAQQFDSATHAQQVGNIREARRKIVLDSEKDGAARATTNTVEEEGSILAGYAVAGGVGAAAAVGALTAGLGAEDIEDIVAKVQEHAGVVMAGIVSAGAVGLAIASRGRTLRYGNKIQKNAARQQVTQQAQKAAATTTQPSAMLPGTIGTGAPNAIPAVRVDPAFMQREWDEKFFGLFKTNYKMRNIYGRVQNSYEAAVSYLNDTAIHAQRVLQLSKQDPDALGRMLPELFSAKSLDDYSGIDKDVLTELRTMFGADFYGSEKVLKHLTGNGTLHRAALDPERIVKNLKSKGVSEKVWEPAKQGQPPKRTWEDAASGKVSYHEVIQDSIIANMDPNNPMKTLDELVKVEAGLMQAITESMMFDDLINKFGSANPKQGMVRITGGHPYLEGMYLDEAIVPEVQQLIGRLNKIDDFKVSNKFMASWDILNRVWKTQVTIYRPAHHVRNYVGDMFLAWMDVNGGAAGLMRDHNFAWRLLSARGGNKYINQATGEFLPAADVQMYGRTRDYWLNPSKRGPTNAADLKIRNKSVGEINGDVILDKFNEKGLAHGAPTLEDIALEDAGRGFQPLEDLTKMQPFGGKVKNAGSMAAVYREHSIRLTHFVNVARSVRVPKSVMKQGREAQLEYIFDEAAQRTRKYHPDGLDMTPAERRIARRVIPFYSWMRKATPLVFNAYFFKPYSVTAYPKLTDSMTYGSIGDTERFLPEDETWTDEQLASVPYLQRRFIAPQTGVLASIGYYGPSTPFLDQTKEFIGGAYTPGGVAGATAKTLAGGINPFARVPLELATNTQFGFNSPVSRQDNRAGDYAQYAVEQTAGLTGEGLRRATSRSGFGHEAFNWATGAGRVDFSNSKYFAIEDTQNRRSAAAQQSLEPSQDPNYQAWLQSMGLTRTP